MGIQFGSYHLTGRFQDEIEETPIQVIKFISKLLNTREIDQPIIYTKRLKTYRQHIKIIRDSLDVRLIPALYHSVLKEYLVKKSPDPGHYPGWIRLVEDHLRNQRFVLSARNTGLEQISEKIWETV